jgi:hypothetical protein
MTDHFPPNVHDLDMDLEEIEEDIVVEDPMDMECEDEANDSFEIT